MGKTRGMGAGRKLKNHRRAQLWADKSYKKSHLGNEWKKPFAGSSHAKGIVLEKIGIEAKQPNSAIRKCARVQLIKNGKKIAAFVPNDGCLNYIEENKREDRKESEIKGNWTVIYQLIGFDNVFQGVWFQGVTQLAVQRGCHFSAIPIILSVLVSLATIVAVFVKISKVQELEENLHKDKLCSKALQSLISICEHNDVDFNFDTIGDADEKVHRHLDINFDKDTVKSKRKSIYLLGLLTIASILFAWLIGLIMCGKYV